MNFFIPSSPLMNDKYLPVNKILTNRSFSFDDGKLGLEVALISDIKYSHKSTSERIKGHSELYERTLQIRFNKLQKFIK